MVMGMNRRLAIVTSILTFTTLSVAQKVRYFKAEHGVGATYVRLGDDGQYKVINREHMGIFLTDEGHWQQTDAVITFSPKDPKRSSYQATEKEHKGKTFLAITSSPATADASW